MALSVVGGERGERDGAEGRSFPWSFSWAVPGHASYFETVFSTSEGPLKYVVFSAMMATVDNEIKNLVALIYCQLEEPKHMGATAQHGHSALTVETPQLHPRREWVAAPTLPGTCPEGLKGWLWSLVWVWNLSLAIFH